MKFGKITDEDIRSYHAADAFSSTKAKVFAASPLLYYKRFVERSIPPPGDTQEFLIGHAAHTLLLEPEAYDKRYYVVPAGVGRKSTKDLTLRASLAEANPGKFELSADDDVLNRRMVAAVLAHPEAARLLDGGESETTWRIRGAHFAVQARTDRFNANGWPGSGWPYICDFKTTASLKADNPKCFRRTFWSYNYHLSAHLYREVVCEILRIPANEPRPRFYWIVAEKEEPLGVEVFEIDDFAYDLASRQLHDILTRLRRCYETGVWPGSPASVQVLTPPAWLVREISQETEPNVA